VGPWSLPPTSEAGGEHRYRYAVVCGGEAGKRALRDASLDPGDEI
jgi:hypothetical protein